MKILVISDVHANLVALETVLKETSDIEFDDIWSLGDVVGYGPRPCESVDLIREIAPNVSIIGNHDWAAIGRLDLNDFNPVAKYASYWTTMKLGIHHLQYLESLPNRMIEDDWTIVHGSPQHPVWEYVYNARIAAINFGFYDTRICFIGHTHIQLYITESAAHDNIQPRQPRDNEVIDVSTERIMINPGSVGQPRDGDPRAGCAIFDTNEMTVTFRRIPYDIKLTQQQMRNEGLPESLVMRLSMGV
jgi:diadenosine tetraphosphatase ApaH/serine/threonine PP2A family protein phosphatase